MARTLIVYSFSELSEVAKKKAFEALRFEVMPDYWDRKVIEKWRKKLTEWGFIDAKIVYSHLYCQGQGASFTCNEIDWLTFLKKEKAQRRFRLLIKYAEQVEITYKIYRIDRMYAHENTVSIESDCRFWNYSQKTDRERQRADQIYMLHNELSTYILEKAKSLMREICKDLLDENWRFTEEPAVYDILSKGKYEFMEDGTPYGLPED